MKKLNCGCQVWEPEDRYTHRRAQHSGWKPWRLAQECTHHAALRTGETEPATKHDRGYVASIRLIALEEQKLETLRKLAVSLLVDQSDKASTT